VLLLLLLPQATSQADAERDARIARGTRRIRASSSKTRRRTVI